VATIVIPFIFALLRTRYGVLHNELTTQFEYANYSAVPPQTSYYLVRNFQQDGDMLIVHFSTEGMCGKFGSSPIYEPFSPKLYGSDVLYSRKFHNCTDCHIYLPHFSLSYYTESKCSNQSTCKNGFEHQWKHYVFLQNGDAGEWQVIRN
jgi:hypothetical protein